MMTDTQWTIAAIRAANKDAGFYFFSPSTMKAFASKIDRQVYAGPGGVYFVTSEQFQPSSGPAHQRKYTVRRFHPATGDVDTVRGTHQKYDNVLDARAFAKELSEWNEE